MVMGQQELARKLKELGYAIVGPQVDDPRYNVWVRARDGRKLFVPGHSIVNDYTAERILADAAR